MLEVLEDPSVGAAAPMLRVIGSNSRVHGLKFTGPDLNVGWLTGTPGETTAVPFLCGCFFGMRRDLFDEVGGFDSGMRGYGCEDLELGLRLWRLGYESRAVPQAEIAHLWRQHDRRSPSEWQQTLQNLIRLATLHLSDERLARTVDALRLRRNFAAALATVLAGDVLERRAQFEATARRSSAAFLSRFDMAALYG
jgi:GT2 family glycosyltransferase